MFVKTKYSRELQIHSAVFSKTKLFLHQCIVLCNVLVYLFEHNFCSFCRILRLSDWDNGDLFRSVRKILFFHGSIDNVGQLDNGFGWDILNNSILDSCRTWCFIWFGDTDHRGYFRPEVRKLGGIAALQKSMQLFVYCVRCLMCLSDFLIVVTVLSTFPTTDKYPSIDSHTLYYLFFDSNLEQTNDGALS